MFNKLRVNHTPVIFRGFFALLFSLLFLYAPMNQKVLEGNYDIDQYILRIGNLKTGSDSYVDESNLLQFITSEPIWGYILTYIGEFFDKPIDGLQLVSFCSIFIYAFFLCGRINLFLASIFLFNPIVVDLCMAQVRSALAMALCLVALMIKNRLASLIVIACASMIHTATFILLMVYFFAKFLESKRNSFTYKKLGIAALSFGIVLANIMGGGREILRNATGDRRFVDETGVQVAPPSLLYVSYWMFLALALALPFTQRYDDKVREYWTIYYSIVMLSLPLLTAFYNIDSLRFVALSFPIILYSMSTYTIPVRASLIGNLFVYQMIQYLYRI